MAKSSANSAVLQASEASTSKSQVQSISADHKSDLLSHDTQSLSSRESAPDINLELLRINAALEILQQSPIPSWKVGHGRWTSNKIDRVGGALKEKLDCHDELPDKIAFNEVITGLKRKYQDDDTTKTEKIQILTVLPDSWSNAKISKEFNAPLYTVRKAKQLKEEKGALALPNPPVGGSALPGNIVDEVESFYNDDTVSVNMPGMKDFVSVRDTDGKRTHKQKRLLLANLKELYEHFKSSHPDLSIGFSKFASLRPKHCVSAGASGTHTSCVCITHQNMKLMLLGCDIRKLLKDSEFSINGYEDCLNMIICAEPNVKCYFGDCIVCPGVGKLRQALERAIDDRDIESITYKQWVAKPRMTLETMLKGADEFIDELCDSAKNLLSHAFIAKAQAQYFRYLRENLKEGEFLVVCDFAENYAFIVQQAVVGFHWNNNQATVYPVVVYFNENQSVVHRSLVIISDCLHHDAIAVHVFNRVIQEFIRSICENPIRTYYFSDGAPQQYKNFKNFGNLSLHEKDFGVPAEWHFFASAHGKGPCDGVGGTLKRLAARAGIQLPLDRQILTPRDLYEWASEPTNVPAITARYSSTDDYNAQKEILESRFKEIKAVPKTQKQHCVIPGPDGTLKCKRYSVATYFMTHRVWKNK